MVSILSICRGTTGAVGAAEAAAVPPLPRLRCTLPHRGRAHEPAHRWGADEPDPGGRADVAAPAIEQEPPIPTRKHQDGVRLAA